ncbi:DMT family transporter [Hominifimenecus sp. rT4P-3]|uniref:DMT family transporter n=1 Tax=Hominifimenecus sp. rT4P-3 TaxID=3242979 RepID=UPI003DA3AF8A
MSTKKLATFFAILAAALYAVNIPLSKLLLARVQPTMMAAFLYLGAGLGLFLYGRLNKEYEKGEALTHAELPYTIGMILLDIAAPILLMLGLGRTNSANASLLNNFEIVATSLIAFFVFREALSKRLALAISLVTLASVALSFEGGGSFQFNTGSLLVLGAACCWGLENNCTRMLSSKSSVQITTIKGIFSGLGSLIIALVIGEKWPGLTYILSVLALGFVAYGLSINFYIKAQKNLGAAKTSAYYSIAPFLGIVFGMVVLGERPGIQFYIGLVIMIAATILMVKDTIALQHTHEHTHVHTHEHCHGELVHSHAHAHAHSHTHTHGEDESTHSHTHEEIVGHDHIHG